ncbi:MAG: hypothetical protein LJE91_17505 [Gammaproteobacteria bacterium]|nr:hypothetical protein [Gammaproteobacteria bacterium]
MSATSLDATEAGESFRRDELIPVVITNLLRCKRCQWWAIREYREDCEAHDFVEEEILMINPDLPIAANTALPTWETVLKDFSRYRKNLQVMDSAFAKRLEW